MPRVNFEVVKPLFKNVSLKALQNLFEKLLLELKEFLEVPLIDTRVVISLTREPPTKLLSGATIYSYFVSRTDASDHIDLQIFYDPKFIVQLHQDIQIHYTHLFPYILLREIYRCFIPHRIYNFKSVHFVLYQIILHDAEEYKFSYTNEWQTFIRLYYPAETSSEIIYYRFRDQVKGYLTQNYEAHIKFFFAYLQKYFSFIEEDEPFREILFQVQEQINYELFFNNPDYIEAICVVDKLLQINPYIKSLSEYKQMFSSALGEGIISTNLSQNAFDIQLDTMHHSEINPSWAIDWSYLGMLVVGCWVKFHPLLSNIQIDTWFSQFDFIYYRYNTFNSMANDSYLAFLIPEVYKTDLLHLFAYLKRKGYITQYQIFHALYHEDFYNFNGLHSKDALNNLIDPHDSNYDASKALSYKRNVLNEKGKISLSFLEMEILALGYQAYASSGLGVLSPNERLKELHNTLNLQLNEKHSIIFELKSTIQQLLAIPDAEQEFTMLLTQSSKLGFQYIQWYIGTLNKVLEILRNYFLTLPKREPQGLIIERLRSYLMSDTVNSNMLFTYSNIWNKLTKDLIPLYFSSKEQFFKKCTIYRQIELLVNTCSKANLLNLQDIIHLATDSNYSERIFNAEQQKLDTYYGPLGNKVLTHNELDAIVQKFLNISPPLLYIKLAGIEPPTVFSYIYVVTPYSEHLWNITTELIPNFRLFYRNKWKGETPDIMGNQESEYIIMLIYTPYLIPEEWFTFMVSLYQKLNGKIIQMKRYLGYAYMTNVRSYRAHYEYKKDDVTGAECGEFRYIPERFESYQQFGEELFGKGFPELTHFTNPALDLFFPSKKITMENVFSLIEQRTTQEMEKQSKQELELLISFMHQLHSNSLSLKQIKTKTSLPFVKKYVKSITLLPNFPQFGMGRYFLYIYPLDMRNIARTKGSSEGLDYHLLLGNTFQKVWHTATIDTTFPLLIQYIFPFDEANKSYLNWLTGVPFRNPPVREYCMFLITKVHYNLHLDWNIEEGKWTTRNLSKLFANYVQKILYDPTYQPLFAPMITFNHSKIPDIILGPESQEFHDLLQCYGRESLDLLSKRFMKRTTKDAIIRLLNKGLVKPYAELKNMRLTEEFLFIIPDISEAQYEVLIKLFRYFNWCIIHEIQGEQYIHGLEQKLVFSKGLFIQLFLPSPQILKSDPESYSNILQTFEQVFRLLNIKHSIILYGMVDGEIMVHNVFNEESILVNTLKTVPLSPYSLLHPNSILSDKDSSTIDLIDSYNPLINLKWHTTWKKWLNHSLFTKEFVVRYPSLLYGKQYFK